MFVCFFYENKNMKLFLNKNSIGINELRKVCPTQRFNPLRVFYRLLDTLKTELVGMAGEQCKQLEG